MNAIVPIPKCDIAIRVATLADLPALDALQKPHVKALGYFPTQQFEGYLKMGAVLVAEVDAAPVGYVIARDRYLKRDELGVIYQLCVAPGAQRKLVGATLVKEVFARSAYGCRLYCCWCAQDLEANHFWESLGFVPIAFRAGSSGKRRVHIFWQKRIVEGDTETKWWYPFQTNAGAIRQDRIVFPIPPYTHWSEVQAVAVPVAQTPALEAPTAKAPRDVKVKPLRDAPRPVGLLSGFRFASEQKPKAAKPAKATKQPPAKIDPRFFTAARELRDRWMERVNTTPVLPVGKYEVSRALASTSPVASAHAATPLLPPLAA
jgi:ribosomal protein S18 acetylase RimI-like enzyme